MSSHPLSLANLIEPPAQDIYDAVTKARRLVSSKTGIISKVELEDINPQEPSVFFARSTPSNIQALGGEPLANYGDAVSCVPERAVMKAMGETLERYSPAFHNREDWVFAAWEDLKGDAVNPSDLALFSDRQYQQPGFPFQPFTTTSSTHWVQAHSLSLNKPVWAPASFIYLPYFFDTKIEPKTHLPISTGLACGSSYAMAIQKGIFEILERDAFMMSWKNRIPATRIDYSNVSNPLTQKMLDAVMEIHVNCHAFLLWHDLSIPVILVILESASNSIPLAVMGISADLDPERGLALALEEACLGYVGMNRFAATQTDFQCEAEFINVNTLDRHGLAHALDPELKNSWAFLDSGKNTISLKKINAPNPASTTANIKRMVREMKQNNLQILVYDLTTPDLDEAGFKVVRSMIPGMLPLDTNHQHRHLGGKRLYEVPVQSGKQKKKNKETTLNPYPHMFP